MKKQLLFGREINLSSLALITTMVSPVFFSGCSSSYERGADLVEADAMKEGPGVFSGDKGGFYIAGGKEKTVASKPVSKMSASETSKVIDEKIEQLKRDQIELEALKNELNKKVQN